MRKPRRQPGRFFQGAVEIGIPVHGAVADFAQQHFGDGREFGFGIAHRRERFRVVARAEIALAFDQRIAIRERLRHQHQGFVTGAVAVGVIFADDIADSARGFFRLGARVEAQLAHREDDPPLHRLQAIADEGQGAVQDHVHRVVEIRALGVLAKRNLFEAVEGGADGVGHGGSREENAEKTPVILPAAVAPGACALSLRALAAERRQQRTSQP